MGEQTLQLLERTQFFALHFSRVIAVFDNDTRILCQDTISFTEEVSRVSTPSLLLHIP
jgi:hypothetical protein